MRPLVIAVLNLSSLFASASVIKLDDHDASITYSPEGAWILGGVEAEYSRTTTFTRTPYASFSFTFNGTGIEIIGTLDEAWASGFTFAIDDGAEQTVAVRGGFTAYGVTLARVQNLTDAEHTFVLTNGGPSNTSFVLDAIQYTNGQPDPTTTPTSGSSGSFTPLGLGNSTPTHPSTSAPTSSGDSTPASANIGALAGGIVGGVFLGILLAIGVLFYRRRLAQIVQQRKPPKGSPHPSSSNLTSYYHGSPIFQPAQYPMSMTAVQPHPSQQPSVSSPASQSNGTSLPGPTPPSYIASMLIPDPYPHHHPTSSTSHSSDPSTLPLPGKRRQHLPPPFPTIQSAPKREKL